ncbi:hypothetical protein OESDEN_06184 [Oesophagostomum dentatum]|uniref:Uncharacterized protein n=1 Tax=Oesophagostomum dentatum TaxID=61180 RepID=A0A0B1TES5_OESDE|nr:hypothetical protein OESDEN_06184 [Oesophagostomum dentatum]
MFIIAVAHGLSASQEKFRRESHCLEFVKAGIPIQTCGKGRCDCRPTYSRDDNGKCIPVEQCNKRPRY